MCLDVYADWTVRVFSWGSIQTQPYERNIVRFVLYTLIQWYGVVRFHCSQCIQTTDGRTYTRASFTSMTSLHKSNINLRILSNRNILFKTFTREGCFFRRNRNLFFVFFLNPHQSAKANISISLHEIEAFDNLTVELKKKRINNNKHGTSLLFCVLIQFIQSFDCLVFVSFRFISF